MDQIRILKWINLQGLMLKMWAYEKKKSFKLVSKPATLPGGLGMTNFAFAIIFNYGGPEVLNKTTFWWTN